MAVFQYKARDDTGSLVTGRLNANSADAVAATLSGRNITPIEIKRLKGKKNGGAGGPGSDFDRELSTIERINVFLAGSKIEASELIMFSRQMFSLTKAGLPLDRSITGLAASLENQTFRKVLMEVTNSLESGVTLAGAMARHPKVFSNLFLSLISVGENTGQLDRAFKEISKYLELEQATTKQVKSATRYPIFVLVAISVALGIITYFVIPVFADTFSRLGAELPLETRILIAVSDFVVGYWPFMLLTIFGSILLFRSWVKTDKGKIQWDKTKLRLPLVGPVFEKIALGRFARTFSMVMSAGVPIVQGLNVVAGAIGNEYIARNVIGMQEGISRGESLYNTAVASDMFTPVILQMISVGEESGTIDDLLEEVADFYDIEVEYDVKKLGDAIEPILIMFIAGLVLILALGVFLPIWDLNTAANG